MHAQIFGSIFAMGDAASSPGSWRGEKGRHQSCRGAVPVGGGRTGRRRADVAPGVRPVFACAQKAAPSVCPVPTRPPVRRGCRAMKTRKTKNPPYRIGGFLVFSFKIDIFRFRQRIRTLICKNKISTYRVTLSAIHVALRMIVYPNSHAGKQSDHLQSERIRNLEAPADHAIP